MLAKPYHAILGTNRAEGGPQLTVIWHLWDGEAFYFSTMTSRVKYRNIVHDPRITLLVNEPSDCPPWYVVAYGNAEFIPQTPDFRRRLMAKYMPGVPFDDGAVDPERVIVVLRPQRMITGS